MGLGETGGKSDYDIVCAFFVHENPNVKSAAMIAMWYLSKDDTVKHAMDSFKSGIPKIKRQRKSF